MRLLAFILPMALIACDAQSGAEPEEFMPEYRGIETQLLKSDLVQFNVEMTGARNALDVKAYAECAAAQYTLIRGYGFARHVRTNTTQTKGVWRADAVYTISPSIPRGLRTIEAEVVHENCVANNIPTV